MKFLLLITFIISVTISAKAQSTDTTVLANSPVSAATKTSFVAGITFNSALNYYGRTDSLKSKGLYPFVGINFKNGFYLNSSFVFINNESSTEYAATIAEAGYQFKSKTNKWSGNLFANSFFYQNNIALVQSALKGIAGVNLTYLNKIINVNINGDLKLSNSIDYGASAGIDHTLRIDNAGKGIIVFDPSAYVHAGTQNFTKTYYQQKQLLFLPAGEEQVTKNSKQFNILSYELSLPVVYALGKLNIILSPSYVIPQHMVMVPERPDLPPPGNNLFYVTATVKITI